jgi:hypothetical protein
VVKDSEYSDEYRNQLQALFDEFDGRLISPGGAAGLLGVSRKTIHELGRRNRLRMFRGPDSIIGKGILKANEGPRWVYIPLEDVARYAEEVGRPFPESLKKSLNL